MTAEQIRRRKNVRTVLWSVLAALAVAALAFSLYHSLASASHCAVWDPISGTCSVFAPHNTTTTRARPTYPPTTSPIPPTLPPTTQPPTTSPPTTEYYVVTTTPTTSPPTTRPPTTQPPTTYPPTTSPIAPTLPPTTRPPTTAYYVVTTTPTTSPPTTRPPTTQPPTTRPTTTQPPYETQPSTTRPTTLADCEHTPQGCPTTAPPSTTPPPTYSQRPIVVPDDSCSDAVVESDCEGTVTLRPVPENDPSDPHSQAVHIWVCWESSCHDDDDGGGDGDDDDDGGGSPTTRPPITYPPTTQAPVVCESGQVPGPDGTCIEVEIEDEEEDGGIVCTGDLGPNAAGDGCECPAGQVQSGANTCAVEDTSTPCPSGQHAHGTSGCHADTPPPCPSGQVLTGHHVCGTTTTLGSPPTSGSPGTTAPSSTTTGPSSTTTGPSSTTTGPSSTTTAPSSTTTAPQNLVTWTQCWNGAWTTGTCPTTTTTTDPKCRTAGQHHHTFSSGGEYCHSPHTPIACHSIWEGSYRMHDPNDPNNHIGVLVEPCGTTNPPPVNTVCPGGYHYHALPNPLCHQDHVRPACHRLYPTLYYDHDPDEAPDGHHNERVDPCPFGPTTTTTISTTTSSTISTTTTSSVSTTTSSVMLTCGAIPQSELDRVKALYGWDSDFDYPSTALAGTAIPQGSGTGSLFITSDKLSSPGAAEPQIWPVFPSSPSLVTDGGGCIWESMEVRSVWRELYIWNAADRLLIGQVVPSFITRWNNLSTVQRDILRNGHNHTSRTPGDCPVSTTNPRSDCAFYLPHPMVYAWQLQVRFETNSGGTTQESWETLWSGTSYLVRLIDYADWQSTISGR